MLGIIWKLIPLFPATSVFLSCVVTAVAPPKLKLLIAGELPALAATVQFVKLVVAVSPLPAAVMIPLEDPAFPEMVQLVRVAVTLPVLYNPPPSKLAVLSLIVLPLIVKLLPKL